MWDKTHIQKVSILKGTRKFYKTQKITQDILKISNNPPPFSKYRISVPSSLTKNYAYMNSVSRLQPFT